MGLFRSDRDRVAAEDFRDLTDQVTELRQILDRRLSAPTTPPAGVVADLASIKAAISSVAALAALPGEVVLVRMHQTLRTRRA